MKCTQSVLLFQFWLLVQSSKLVAWLAEPQEYQCFLCMKYCGIRVLQKEIQVNFYSEIKSHQGHRKANTTFSKTLLTRPENRFRNFDFDSLLAVKWRYIAMGLDLRNFFLKKMNQGKKQDEALTFYNPVCIPFVTYLFGAIKGLGINSIKFVNVVSCVYFYMLDLCVHQYCKLLFICNRYFLRNPKWFLLSDGKCRKNTYVSCSFKVQSSNPGHFSH